MTTASRCAALGLLVMVLAGCSGPYAGAPYRFVRDDLGSCVVAYRGPYRAGQLPLARRAAGRFAVLILRGRHPAVRRLLVVDRCHRACDSPPATRIPSPKLLRP